MKHTLPCLTILWLVFGGIAVGQDESSHPGSTVRGASSEDPEVNQSIHLMGKVVVEDGSPLPGSAAVRTVCKGSKHTVARTDSQGKFEFTIGTVSDAKDATYDASGGSDRSPFGNTGSAVHNRREWRWCGLQAELAGFTSDVVEISSRTDSFHGGDIGSLVLRRLGHKTAEPGTISATSAAAPESATRAFDKGNELEQEDNWDEAEKSFQRAVQIYPKYADAWFQLGEVQLAKRELDAAGKSFNQSLAADPHFADGYLGLVEIAARGQKWQEMLDLTDKLIALNTGRFVDAWFYKGLAYYGLQKISEAEKSVVEGMKLDPQHHFPKLEYLMGLIRAEQHDFAGANDHLQKYLHLVSNPRDVAEAQRTLSEIARLSATASTTPAKN